MSHQIIEKRPKIWAYISPDKKKISWLILLIAAKIIRLYIFRGKYLAQSETELTSCMANLQKKSWRISGKKLIVDLELPRGNLRNLFCETMEWMFA